MPVLRCYIDDRRYGALLAASHQTGRTVEELAEAAISEAAMQAERGEPRRRQRLDGGGVAGLALAALLAFTPAPADAASPSSFRELERVNRQVNRELRYQSDQEQYGVPDIWTAMPASGRGDCEDFALTKLARLIGAGVDPARMEVWEVGGANFRHTYHAVLYVMADDGHRYALDMAPWIARERDHQRRNPQRRRLWFWPHEPAHEAGSAEAAPAWGKGLAR